MRILRTTSLFIFLIISFLPSLVASQGGGQVKLFGIEGSYTKKPDGTIYLYPGANTYIPGGMQGMSALSGMSGMDGMTGMGGMSALQTTGTRAAFPPPPGYFKRYRYAPPQRFRPHNRWFQQNQWPRVPGAYSQFSPPVYGRPSFGPPWAR